MRKHQQICIKFFVTIYFLSYLILLIKSGDIMRTRINNYYRKYKLIYCQNSPERFHNGYPIFCTLVEISVPITELIWKTRKHKLPNAEDIVNGCWPDNLILTLAEKVPYDTEKKSQMSDIYYLDQQTPEEGLNIEIIKTKMKILVQLKKKKKSNISVYNHHLAND